MANLLFYCSLMLGIWITEEALIPKRDNVVIIVNVEYKYFNGIETLIQELVYGISLLHYRISLHSSHGVSTNFFDFQSKECILNQLKQRRNQKTPLLTLLQKSLVDITDHFPSDQFFYLIISDEELNNSDRVLLDTISARKNCQQVNIIYTSEHKSRENYSFRKNIQIIYPKKEGFISLPYFTENLRKCNGSTKKGFDECNRECRCVNGQWINCFRVRKEFSLLSYEERTRYINTYKDLSSSNQYKKAYDRYCKYHHTYFKRGIHKKSQFFPWHRKYILGFENMIRLIDCRITVPVWNWAGHSYHPWSITPNYHMWRQKGGFGGNGIHKYSYCVKTGIFQSSAWKTPEYENSNTIDKISCGKHKHCGYKYSKDKRCLRRRFQCHTPRLKSVHYALTAFNLSSFEKFEREVRTNWHNIVHHCTGGTMATNYASDTPEFWLHHGMLDSLWDKWQHKGKQYKFVGFQYSRNMTLLGFYPSEIRYQFIDNLNLGTCGIKIKYDNALQNDTIFYKRNYNHHNHQKKFNHHHRHHSYHRYHQHRKDSNTYKPRNDTNTRKAKPQKDEFKDQNNFHYHHNKNNENLLNTFHSGENKEENLSTLHQKIKNSPEITASNRHTEDITSSNFVPNINDLILLKQQHDEHPQLRSDSGNIYDLLKKQLG